MIVMVIIAVLGAIALPSYNDYILRSRLAEAYASLGEMAVKLEQYYQDNRTYVGACQPGTVAPNPSAQLKYFSIVCPVADLTNTTFRIRADGNAGTNVAGFVFRVDNTGLKETFAVPAGSGYSTNATCWVRRKGSGATAC
jgi:type IV pilus assembly protein PilE